MSRLTLALLLLTFAASAQEREVFPSDYKRHPCASASRKLCATFSQSEIPSAGTRMQAYNGMDVKWIAAHWNELTKAYAPYCAKLATCYATGSNTYLFCDDVVMPETMQLCERFSAGSKDREQCTLFIRTYDTGITLKSFDAWREIQECSKKNASAAERTMEVWTSPATLPVDFRGTLKVFAIDAETRVPIQAAYTVGKENLFADTPGGNPTTGYWLKWRTRLERVKNAQGHRDVVAPIVKVRAPGYAPVEFPMPVAIPTMNVSLVREKNHVIVKAVDAKTGKPVEARVMLGERPLGQTNEPLQLAPGNTQEVWVTSMYDHYSDVIVVPAKKR